MLNENQDQKVQDGSVALQARRDINVYQAGMTFTEVRELCLLLLQNNFPKLRDEACQTSMTQVRQFAAELEERFVNDARKIILEKLKEPDVQATINDAVLASARKGTKANPKILCTLISERLAANTSDFKDMVLAEAVQVVPKLTASQISLMSFVHFIKSMSFQSIKQTNQLEAFGQIGLSAFSQGFNLSEPQKLHIQYAGAGSLNYFAGGDIYEELNKGTYKHLQFPNGNEFKSVCLFLAPSFAKLLNQFNLENLFQIGLTSVGQAIALANLSVYFGEVDYALWIK